MMNLKQVVNDHIFHVLKKVDFNRSKAARILDISLKTVHNKIPELISAEYDVKTPKEVKNERSVFSKRDHRLPIDDSNETFGMATNEERLKHADDIINRNYL